MNGASEVKLVTVAYFWKLSKKNISFALLRMALDRVGLRRFPGVSFAKMLGTGKGETFTPKDADVTRWGAVITIDENFLARLDASPIVKRWRTVSYTHLTLPTNREV